MGETTGYSPRHRVERVVSTGRLVLATFLCLGLLVDPAEPGRHATLVRAIAASYFAYALGNAAWWWLGRRAIGGWPLATHVADMVLFAVLMHLSEGPSSPFFVYFVFATLCGAIRWHGLGAFATGAAALVLYVTVTVTGTTYFGTGTVDGLRFVTRCAHLATVAALLAYLGAHHRRREREIGNLARWPRRRASGEDELCELLAHAAETLGTRRVVLAWEDEDEPWLRVASLDEAGCRIAKAPPDRLGVLVADRLTTTFMCDDLSLSQPRTFVRDGHGLRCSRGPVLSTEFMRDYPARSVLALRLAGESVQGWLLALDTSSMSIDDLVLGDVVARLATGTLELEVRLRQLRDNAAAEERLRLARELHDGVLQALTATALQVQAARNVLRLDAAAAEERLTRVQDTVLAEQRAIRHAVDTLNPRYARFAPKADTLSRVRDCVNTVARQWDLRVRVQIPRTSLPVASHVVHDVSRMASEALANAARHGAASDVVVACDLSTTGIGLSVEHRGRGFTGLNGRYDLPALSELGLGPRTLMDRVAALGGSLTVVSHMHGARIEIDVPIGTIGAGSPQQLPLAKSS